MNTLISFSNYFQAFEEAVATDQWQAVEQCLADDVRYTVVNVPFACDIRGRENVVAGMQRSIRNFDAQMDERMLDVVSVCRLDHNQIRVELISGYTRGEETIRIPVSMHIKSDQGRLTDVQDVYDPNWTLGAVGWLAKYASDLDPSYV